MKTIHEKTGDTQLQLDFSKLAPKEIKVPAALGDDMTILEKKFPVKKI